MMANRTTHLDDLQLQVLVFGDEESDEYRVTAAHVETCDVCQSRLRRFAGAEHEREVSELLGGYARTEDCDAPPSESQDSLEHRAELDFLGAPNHPEMLGRLGRYEIERVIGSGGMGIVLKGFDTELNRPVAIKVLARHLAHSGAARQRFARESRAAAAVVHEHVVAIHNVETEREFPFLVMQYISGESVQARVDRLGPLDAKEILRIGIQAAAGLAAAHEQGVIHRDIKPANILLENGVERVLITDFGLARTVDDASLTQTGVVAGTPNYMSPEQANGEATDHRTDLFSLGSVLYFMATGRPPFRAERAMGVLNRICHDRQRPVWDINSSLPDQLSDAIDRLLEKRPEKRFATAMEAKETLSRLLARLQNGALRRRGPIGRLVCRRPLAAGAALAIPLLVAIASVAVIASRPSTLSNSDSGSVGPAEPKSTANTSDSVGLTSEDILAQATEYSVAAGTVSELLTRLEAQSTSTFLFFQDDAYSQQVESYDKQLDQLQGDRFFNSSDLPVSGVRP